MHPGKPTITASAPNTTSQESGRGRRGFVETELVQVEDVKREAELVAKLGFADHRRAGLVRLAGVACQDQAASTGGQVLRHGGCVLLRCGSSDG